MIGQCRRGRSGRSATGSPAVTDEVEDAKPVCCAVRLAASGSRTDGGAGGDEKLLVELRRKLAVVVYCDAQLPPPRVTRTEALRACAEGWSDVC